MHLVLFNRFWFVYITVDIIVKLLFLAQFTVEDHFAFSRVWSTLFVPNCYFSLLCDETSYGFLPITWSCYSIALVNFWRLKHSYSCFSPYFSFLVFIFLLLLMLPWLLLAAVISLSFVPLNAVLEPLHWLIFKIHNAGDSSLFLSRHIYNLSLPSLGYKAFFIVINFIALRWIYLCPFLVHFKNGPDSSYYPLCL